MPDPRRGTLLVMGAGGHGKVVAETAEAAGWSDVRFLDDRVPTGSRVAAWPVEGTFPTALQAAKGTSVVVAVGDNALRLDWIDRLARLGIDCPAIVSPHAIVSSRASIGEGTVVVAGAIVAIAARIGRACIVNTACSIDHDCEIGDGTHVSPGARLGGGVIVGARSWIGIGATVRNDLRIGTDAVIGAGSTVVRPVADGSTVIGVAAQPKRRDASESAHPPVG
ncbi:MAG: acetyltransferase [Phycisphaerae bacterium]|nr:acetyltransferase [Phycisphaerae bacterium]